MKYIFEDHPDADISRLFKLTYPSDVLENFIYTRGNCNIQKCVEEQLLSSDDFIAVFMDMIPGNKACHSLYNHLKQISKVNNYRVIIFPIVCAEYYMICSIKNYKLFSNVAEVQNCISKIPHLLSHMLQKPDVAKYCKNFEKYCKYILKYTTKTDCLKPYNQETDLNGEYYTENCQCSLATNDCTLDTLLNKSSRLLKEYPCVPAGNNSGRTILLSSSEVWDLHRQLVNEYNTFVDSYLNVDKQMVNVYKKIQYIQ